MLRSLAALALLAPGLSLTALAVEAGPAVAGDPATCAGQTVTIDLNQPDHPDPKRSAADVILGTAGEDDIEAGAGADVVCGGAGDDFLQGNKGDDVLYGEDGNDYFESLLGNPGNDRAYGGPGDDLLDNATPGSRYFGGPGIDDLWSLNCREYKAECGPGKVRLSGGADDDSFNTSYGFDLIDGGAGSDIVSYYQADGPYGTRIGVTVDLAITGPQDPGHGKPDTLTGVEGLSGTSQFDVLKGDSGPNLIEGSIGRDTLYGRAGDDVLDGEFGIDVCRGGLGDDELIRCEDAFQRAPAPARAGVEPPTCAGQAITIDLNQADHPDPLRPRADVILGTPGEDEIRSGGGDDVICAGDGEDLVNAGAGADLVEGGGARDLVHGGDGADSIRGGEGDDILEGDLGNDLVQGDQGNDDLDQHFLKHNGKDRLRGGADRDSLYNGEPGDRYFGGPGDDLLITGSCRGAACPAGTLRMAGGDGDDWITPGRHDDFVDGGPGRDVVDYGVSGAPAPHRRGVTVDLAITGPQDTGPGMTDTLRRLEDLEGSDGPDRLYGNARRNEISAEDGDDLLFGRGGDDRLSGLGGEDVCRGGAGHDRAVFGCDRFIQ